MLTEKCAQTSAQPGRGFVIAGRLAAKVLPKRQMYVFSTSILPLLDQIKAIEVSWVVLVFRRVSRLDNLPQSGTTDSKTVQRAKAAAPVALQRP